MLNFYIERSRNVIQHFILKRKLINLIFEALNSNLFYVLSMKKINLILYLFISLIIISCHTKKETNDEKQETNQTKEVLVEKEMHSLKNVTVHNPFLGLKFDEVIAYDYETNMDSEQPYIISNDRELNPAVTQKKVLISEQISKLKTFLGNVETYGHTRADCFEPHLGIVFYKDKKVVAHISICIICNHLASSIEIPATSAETYTYQSDKTMEFPMDGFSPKAKQFLSEFCQNLGFSHCEN